MKFFIVDVFTRELFGGNPAGVVLLEGVGESFGFPSEETMLKMAAELRYSETAFVRQKSNGCFVIRYFTPVAEVDVCGHATIGTFYALKSCGIVNAGDKVVAETKAGSIGVIINEENILMDMAEPVLYEKIDSKLKIGELREIMGLKACGDGLLPGIVPQIVSTGIKDIMLPLKDEKDLQSINPNYEALTELSKYYNVVSVHAFVLNAKNGEIHARNFAPLYGIDEEAATGTSNGALAYYLYNNGFIELDQTITVIQGEKMGRASLIDVLITGTEGEEKVKVGGSAVLLAKGDINL